MVNFREPNHDGWRMARFIPGFVPSVCIGLLALLIVSAVFAVRGYQHKRAMIRSVERWDYVGQFIDPGYEYTSIVMFPDGNGGYMWLPQTVVVPSRTWSEWSGIDAEGNRRVINYDPQEIAR